MSTPARVRAPGSGERLLAITTLFLLAYSLPSSWFTPDNTDVPRGDTTVIVVFTALFALAVTRLVGSWRHVARAVKREPLLLAFMFVLVASTVWSTTPDVTFRRSVALVLTAFFGYYLVVRFPLAEIIRLATFALMVGTVINFVFVFAIRKYGITQVTTEAATSGDWSGVFPHKNALGRASLLAALLFVFAARTFPRRRLLYWTFCLLNVVLIVGAQSQTALVSFCLLMVLMVLFTGLRAHATLYGGVAFGLIGTALMGAGFVATELGPISESLGKDPTLTGRTQLWSDVLHEIARKPILGFGWSGFWTGAADGPARYVLERNLWHPPDAHNAVLELLVNVGIVGASLFILVFLRGMFRSIGQVRRTPNILGLFPLAFFSLVLLQSVTEKGVIGRDLSWTMFVVAVVLAGRDRADPEVMRQPTETFERLPTTPPRLEELAVPVHAEASIELAEALPRPHRPRSSFVVRRPPT
jgi:exopolysaccharide production protein ExoQ